MDLVENIHKCEQNEDIETKQNLLNIFVYLIDDYIFRDKLSQNVQLV